jgi:hypothetical protein
VFVTASNQRLTEQQKTTFRWFFVLGESMLFVNILSPHFPSRFVRSSRALGLTALCALLALALSGCASSSLSEAEPSTVSTASSASNVEAEPLQEGWQLLTKAQLMSLPTKKVTRYQTVQRAGRKAIFAQANHSASLYRYTLEPDHSKASKLRFSWKAQQLIEQADMAVRESEDSVVRVILSFEGDRSKFSARNRMLSELSLALTGEELPYATLMYVWCNKRNLGEVIINPRTDRIRKIVIESGRANLGQWLDYERDIRADYLRAFGEEPGALMGIALMTDTDNTQSQAAAWYGPITVKTSGK